MNSKVSTFPIFSAIFNRLLVKEFEAKKSFVANIESENKDNRQSKFKIVPNNFGNFFSYCFYESSEFAKLLDKFW